LSAGSACVVANISVNHHYPARPVFSEAEETNLWGESPVKLEAYYAWRGGGVPSAQ